eukprot:m.80322 g.80322  ORF g.80322 m.80322 type:complete len:193 (-) comp50689_c0_seq3:1020-1598(-)
MAHFYPGDQSYGYQQPAYSSYAAGPAGPSVPAASAAPPGKSNAAAVAAEFASSTMAAAKHKGHPSALGADKAKPNRVAAGDKWHDPQLDLFDPNDYRVFCGDVGNEVSDDALLRAFARYGSVQRARVVRDPKTGKSKGYAFVSFKDSKDYLAALKEMNGKYCGNRPLRLQPSSWKDRQLPEKKEKPLKRLHK